MVISSFWLSVKDSTKTYVFLDFGPSGASRGLFGRLLGASGGFPGGSMGRPGGAKNEVVRSWVAVPSMMVFAFPGLEHYPRRGFLGIFLFLGRRS